MSIGALFLAPSEYAQAVHLEICPGSKVFLDSALSGWILKAFAGYLRVAFDGGRPRLFPSLERLADLVDIRVR
jgi:hypothetical protein